jgi:UDP-perosamine 4-acetyltransferase
VLGSGGHACVVIDLARRLGWTVAAVFDADAKTLGRTVLGVPVVGGDDQAERWAAEGKLLANGVGARPRGRNPGTGPRGKVFIRLERTESAFPALVHPSAVIGEDVGILAGAQVMAGAVLQPRTRVGRNVVVNTRASIDHDCQIGDDAFIAPGAVLCGAVTVGKGAFVGAGAVLLPGATVGDGSIVAAGARVERDVPAGALHRPRRRGA